LGCLACFRRKERKSQPRGGGTTSREERKRWVERGKGEREGNVHRSARRGSCSRKRASCRRGIGPGRGKAGQYWKRRDRTLRRAELSWEEGRGGREEEIEEKWKNGRGKRTFNASALVFKFDFPPAAAASFAFCFCLCAHTITSASATVEGKGRGRRRTMGKGHTEPQSSGVREPWCCGV
jgi:hypothetical protein